MTSFGVGSVSAVPDLLFEQRERWGWEYVPAVEAPFPYSPPADPRPRWTQELARQRKKVTIRRPRALRFLVGTVLWLVVALTLAQLVLFLGGTLTLIVLFVRAYKFPRDAGGYLVAAVGLAHRRSRARSDARGYGKAYASWVAERERWVQAERRRVSAEDLWFPVRLDRASRIDVFGGVAEGWSGLLVTAASGVLGSERPVVVVDLSDEAVAAPLARLAGARGIDVAVWRLPTDLDRLDLLAELDPGQVAEVVAGAVQVLRPSDPEGRMLHTDLLEAVVVSLNGPVTLARLRDGLRVLQGAYDRRAARGTLSAAEVRNVAAHVDLAGTSPRAHDELQFLAGAMGTLTRRLRPTASDEPTVLAPRPRAPTEDSADSSGAQGPGFPLSKPGLTILANIDRNPDRRHLLDGLLVHGLLSHLGRLDGPASTAPPEHEPPLLVLAGVGDHIPHTTLEQLARRSRQAGLRLLLMSEHLRGDLRHLLGGAGSASLLMQLGNAEEAAAAAEFVGREHTFVVSQVTKESGETEGQQDSAQTGEVRRKTEPGGERSEMLWFGLEPAARGWWTSGFTHETTATYDVSTHRTRGSTRESSSTYGETTSQEYRFQVEPTRLQALAPLSYIVVTVVDGERRVVAGSCDPRLAGLDRVSALSRDEVDDAAQVPAEAPDGAGSSDEAGSSDDALDAGAREPLEASGRTPLAGSRDQAQLSRWERFLEQLPVRWTR